MVESENSSNNYQTLKTIIGAIINNPEILLLILKTKKICKNFVKKLPFVVMYVPGRYKSQESCNKVMIENG